MPTEKREISRERLNSCLKRLRKREKSDNKRLAAEISALIKDKVPVKAAFSGEEPLISESVKGLSVYTTENVGERLSESLFVEAGRVGVVVTEELVHVSCADTVALLVLILVGVGSFLALDDAVLVV